VPNIAGVLEGGPDRLPTSLLVQEDVNVGDKVKIRFGYGYEHFVHRGEVRETDGQRVPVFQWCDRTRVAE